MNVMEAGIGYERERVHQQGYWVRLMEELVADQMLAGWLDLLRLNRNTIQQLQQLEGRLVESLVKHPRLAEGVKRLDTIPSVGALTVLTWALEIDDPKRFANVRRAGSYCGLCSAQRQSGDRTGRVPLHKQRNKHLQTMLVEAAKKSAPRDAKLNEIYEREKQRGNANQTTIAVARRLVAYLLACDRENRTLRPELAAETAAA
jgi:transposase